MERKIYKNVIENKKCVTFALAEIMAEKPFHEISVTEVCKKAGISKNTFYRHFENLSDVIYQSISEINEKLVEEAFSFRNHQVDDFIIHVCNGWYENRRIYKGFTQDETIYIIRNMTRKDIIYFFEKNNIDQGKDDLFFEFFSAAFCIFLRWWCLHDFVQTPEEISGRIKNYLYGNVFEELEKYLCFFSERKLFMFEFFAGGTTIFGGNFSEQQGGFVFGFATEQGIRAFAKPNGTDTIHIESEDFGNFDIEIGDTEPKAEEAETFSALVRGIMNCFIESGNIFGGFDAKISSEIPSGSGISVTVPFEILIGKIISGLFFENSVPALRLAQFGQIAESDFFGRPCGISEQLISALGGNVLLDFSDPEIPKFEKIDFDFSKSGYTVAVVDLEEVFSEDFSEILKDLGFVAWNMGHNSLSEADEAEFIAQFPILRQKCGERAVFRALDFFEESRRAKEEAEALENGDFPEFLRIYEESGKTKLKFVPEEKAAEFAEEMEKQGFGVMFVL